MSTQFTKRRISTADSDSLKLVFASASLHKQLINYVAESLDLGDCDGISPSLLKSLSALDCGINMGLRLLAV